MSYNKACVAFSVKQTEAQSIPKGLFVSICSAGVYSNIDIYIICAILVNSGDSNVGSLFQTCSLHER